MTLQERLDNVDRIVIEAARSGLGLHADKLRADELCRQQEADAAAGIYEVVVERNKYGWYVRPRSNLVKRGQRISPNFATVAEAEEWAAAHVADDPTRRSIHIRPVITSTMQVVKPQVPRDGYEFMVETTYSDGHKAGGFWFKTRDEAEDYIARQMEKWGNRVQ